jgi:hypothetical protein
VLKTLHAIDFLIKNGSPPAVMSYKREMYKISSLSGISHMENGLDKGKPIREKACLICDLLNSEDNLMRERAEAFEYRRKFYPAGGPTPD